MTQRKPDSAGPNSVSPHSFPFPSHYPGNIRPYPPTATEPLFPPCEARGLRSSGLKSAPVDVGASLLPGGAFWPMVSKAKQETRGEARHGPLTIRAPVAAQTPSRDRRRSKPAGCPQKAPPEPSPSRRRERDLFGPPPPTTRRLRGPRSHRPICFGPSGPAGPIRTGPNILHRASWHGPGARRHLCESQGGRRTGIAQLACWGPWPCGPANMRPWCLSPIQGWSTRSSCLGLLQTCRAFPISPDQPRPTSLISPPNPPKLSHCFTTCCGCAGPARGCFRPVSAMFAPRHEKP